MPRKTTYKTTLILLSIGMLSLAFNLKPVEAESNTIYVDDDNTTGPWDGTPAYPYQNITSGVSNAIAGDTIFVRDGTYYENVTIDKSLSLVGESNVATIVDPNALAPAFYIIADNVNVSGFTIMNMGFDGIRIGVGGGIGVDRCNISDNRLFGSPLMNHIHAIRALYSNFITIYNNSIERANTSVLLYHSHNNTVSKNVITNIVHNSRGAIDLDRSADNIISGNNIFNSPDLTHGIWLSRARSNIVSANTISSCGIGIYVNVDDEPNILRDNRISYCWSKGIELQYSFEITVIRNNITNCDIGIECGPGLSNNFLYHNYVVDNSVNAISRASSNHWDNGYPSGGNYWGDYNGVDLYRGPSQDEVGSDGIGDTPYYPEEYGIDNYPLMKPYGGDHDIVVREMSTYKTVIGQGFSLNITVAILNYGLYTENCNLTSYANSTPISSQEIILTSRNSTILTHTWNTTGIAKGNYTLKAIADIVPGETDTSDNSLTDRWIIIAIIGDITGPDGWPDGKCDMRDVGSVASLFGVNYPDPRYNPNFDVIYDGKIDMKDIGTVARHFGETDP